MTLLVLEFCDCESGLFLDAVVGVCLVTVVTDRYSKDDSSRLSVSGGAVHQWGEMDVSLTTWYVRPVQWWTLAEVSGRPAWGQIHFMISRICKYT